MLSRKFKRVRGVRRNFIIEPMEARVLFDSQVLYQHFIFTNAISVTANRSSLLEEYKSSEGAWYSGGFGTDSGPPPKDENGVPWGGAFDKNTNGPLGAGQLNADPNSGQMIFHFTPAQISAIQHNPNGSGTFVLDAAGDIGARATHATNGVNDVWETPTDWITPRLMHNSTTPATSDIDLQRPIGNGQVGGLFEDVRSSYPPGEQTTPILDKGPDFHNDFDVSEGVAMTQAQFLSMLRSDGTLHVGLIPSGGSGTVGVGRVKIFNSSFEFLSPVQVDAGGPYSVAQGGQITLSGTGFSFPSPAASFDWDYNYDGNPNDFHVNATGQTPTFSAAGVSAGDHTIALRISDSAGDSNIGTATLTVTGGSLSPNPRSTPISAIAGAPFFNIQLGSFRDSDTSTSANNFTVNINWGESANSNSPGTLSAQGGGIFNIMGSHTYGKSGTYTVTVSVNDTSGGGTTLLDTANVSTLNRKLDSSQTRDLSFWTSTQGQNLIKSFNGGQNATALSTWLATNFPNALGSSAGSHNVSGKTNAQMASILTSLAALRSPLIDAQALTVALNVYATTSSLGGNAGASAGFEIDANGLGVRIVNSGNLGAQFGVANNTNLTIFQVLLLADARVSNGVWVNNNATLISQAAAILKTINVL